MRSRTIASGIAAFALLTSIGSAAAPVAVHGPVSRETTFGAETRRYELYAPRSTPARAVVLLLHGHIGNGRALLGESGRAAPYRRWLEIADREGLVIAAPDGTRGGDGQSGWNDCRRNESNASSDDSGFLAALAIDLRERYRVDPQNVFVAGTSNGGVMSLRLAVEHPDVFHGVAAIAALMPADSACAAPKAPMPVLFMQGTADPLMPFEGGAVGGEFRASGKDRGKVMSAEESARFWARVDGVDGPPARSALPDLDRDDGSSVARRQWPASGRPQVVLYRIDGGGHVEPSRSERYRRFVTRLLGLQNGDIESADETWAFFRAQMQ